MKHEVSIKFHYDGGKRFSLDVLTRVDHVAETILNRLKDRLSSISQHELSDAIEVFLQVATFFECKVNYHLRRALEVALQADYDEEFAKTFFECIERQQIEKKLQILVGLRHYPDDVNSKIGRIRHLVDRRNFLVHFKARRDPIELDDVTIETLGKEMVSDLNGFDTTKIPNPPWVDEFLNVNLVELISECKSIGDWMDESFVVTKYWKGPSAVQSLLDTVRKLEAEIETLKRPHVDSCNNNPMDRSGGSAAS